jgi:uncharacterized membrane protein YczE
MSVMTDISAVATTAPREALTHVARGALWVIGVVAIAAGVVAMLAAGVGMGSVDVAGTGVAGVTGVPFWVAAGAVNASFIVGAVALGGRVRAGTVAAAVAVGPAIGVVDTLWDPPAVAPVALCLLGICCIGAGAASGVASGYGPSPLDSLNLAVAARWPRPLWQTRTLVEIAVTALGIAIGGIWGWGTLAAAVGVGAAFGVTHRLLGAARATLDTEPGPQVVPDRGGNAPSGAGG